MIYNGFAVDDDLAQAIYYYLRRGSNRAVCKARGRVGATVAPQCPQNTFPVRRDLPLVFIGTVEVSELLLDLSAKILPATSNC